MRLIFMLMLTFGCQSASDANLQTSEPVGISTYRSPEIWLTHMKTDLIPYWMSKDALGSPRGRFPTFRCHDGSLFRPEQPCAEFAGDHMDWILTDVGKTFVRMISRQAFFYGVAFHMTGEKDYLDLAKAGVDQIRQVISESGKVASYFEDGDPIFLDSQDSQDLAYAQMGLGFYYYLTRDKYVLDDILKIRKRIFQDYRVEENSVEYLAWEPQQGDQPLEPWLVTHLDQLNAYMLLLLRALPAGHKDSWQSDMTSITNTLLNHFYDEDSGLFWGQTYKPDEQRLGWGQTDFGHSVKTFWMLYHFAQMTNDSNLEQRARAGIQRVLQSAFLNNRYTWASRPYENGRQENCPEDIDRAVNCEQEWWIYAELNQAAAALLFDDVDSTRYLRATQPYWLEHFVDKTHGGIWHMLSTPLGEPKFPKAHQWKNGYHTAEHALVNYISAAKAGKKPLILYFGPELDETAPVFPYFFPASEAQRDTTNAATKVRWDFQ